MGICRIERHGSREEEDGSWSPGCTEQWPICRRRWTTSSSSAPALVRFRVAASSCRPGSESEEPLNLLPDSQAEEHAGQEQGEHHDDEPERRHPPFPQTVLSRAPLRPLEPVGTADGVRVERKLVVGGGLDPGWLGHETGV